MKCNPNIHNKYKKSFFERIAEFFDKLIGIKPEDYGTAEEAKYINEHFNDIRFKMRR